LSPTLTVALIKWHLETGDDTVAALARRAGISRGALRGIEQPDYNPTLQTMVAALAAIPLHRQREFFGEKPVDPAVLARSTRQLRRFADPGGRVTERSFEPRAVARLEPRQLWPALRYVMRARSRPLGRLSSDIDGTVLREILADGAAHFIDQRPDDPLDHAAYVWDRRTGFRDGLDLTGMRIRDSVCGALTDSLVARYREVRGSRAPNFGFVHRVGPDGTRTFYRLLEPLEGADGGPEVLTMTLPQDPLLAHQIFADLPGV
jgi:transcriptional regulator with XRE-family HTH domain